MAVGTKSLHGHCLCGAVSYTLEPPIREIIMCHCSRCRRFNGHVWAGTAVPMDRFSFDTGEADVHWYHESDRFSRGSCRKCGSGILFRPANLSRMFVAAGSLDQPTGLTIAAHVFTADKGDYYDIPSDVECYEQWDCAMGNRLAKAVGMELG